MKPTAMQRSAEKDGGKTTDATSSTPRPKHSTIITVGGSSARSPSSSSLTSPLQRRLSGDLTQILGERDGTPTYGGARVSVIANDSRKPVPTVMSSRDQQKPTSIRSSSTPSMKPPLLNLSQFTPSAKSPPKSSTNSITPSDVVESRASSVRSSQSARPRSSSGGSAAISPDVAAVQVNGYSDDSLSSDSDVFNLTDFCASLPSLPAEEFVPLSSQHHPLPPPTEALPPNPKSVPQPPHPYASAVDHNGASSTPESTRSIPATTPSLPTHPPQTSDTRRTKSSPHKHKKTSRPPLMKGIAENGTFSEEGRDPASSDDVLDIPPETFHVNVKNSVVSPYGDVCEEEEEEEFAGQRDIRDWRSLHERQIISSKGTVRGFKNRVRAGIATFLGQAPDKFNYRAAERGQIVMYMTSMTVVRETHERCKSARNILHTHMVHYEQRDVYMSQQHQRQLRERLGTGHNVPLPQIFIDGLRLGGATELEKLNESGELRKILHRFPKIQVRGMCKTCGGYRFVPCAVCRGSKKSLLRNHFTEEFSALRCMHCNESGLQRCHDCLGQME